MFSWILHLLYDSCSVTLHPLLLSVTSGLGIHLVMSTDHKQNFEQRYWHEESPVKVITKRCPTCSHNQQFETVCVISKTVFLGKSKICFTMSSSYLVLGRQLLMVNGTAARTVCTNETSFKFI
jgi:hypothetical protein